MGRTGKLRAWRKQMIDPNTFQALSATQIFVLGSNGNLWLEQAPFGKVPPSRQQVDGLVRTFQALSATEAVVLGHDNNLWLEQAPFGKVPPPRQQVDANVVAFQALSATQILVLGSDNNLWLEQAPFGTIPPSRQQVDANVATKTPTFAGGGGTTAPTSIEVNHNINIGGPEDGNIAGSISLTITLDGSYNFSGQFNNSNHFGNDMAVVVAIESSKGSVFVFDTSGSISANFPWNNNNWNFNFTGNNATIKDVWADLQAGYSWRYDVAANIDLAGLWSNIQGLFQDVQQVVQVVGSIAALA
jgi:hypothetical protein